MKHLKTYKIFESHDDVDTNVLRDILLEINDDGDWKTKFWKIDGQDRIYYFYNGDKNTSGYVVIIETIRQDEEDEFEGLKPPPVVIETIKILIDYMNSEGFTEHRITFEEEESDSIMSFFHMMR